MKGPSSDAEARAHALAGEFIAQLTAREERAFNELARQRVLRSRIAQIEDSLFLTNRKLSELRLAYESDPANSALGDELKALCDQRIAILRAAVAQAEGQTR